MLQVIQGGAPTAIGLADYLWHSQEGSVRCKKRAIQVPENEKGDPIFLGQRWVCREDNEPYILVPAFYVVDPLRPPPSFLALCEVKTQEDQPVDWSPRTQLRRLIEGNKSTLKLRTELSQAEANRLSALLKNLSPRVEPRPVLDAIRRRIVAIEYHPTQASDPYAAGRTLLISI